MNKDSLGTDAATTDGSEESPDSIVPGKVSESGISEHKRDAAYFLKLEKLKLLEAKKELQHNLPHRYGYKKYKWQREFLECHEKDAFLTAANQVGKSTINITTCIEWCVNTALWKKLFKRRRPRLFWYLYPSMDVASIEFKEKWLPDLMPRKKDDPVYGWKEEWNGKYIHSIAFNTGITVYFKAYTQDVMNLQTATVDAVFCFTKGHLIETKRGLIPIEEITTKDLVLTRKGYKKILSIMQRDAPIAKFYFSDGSTLEGTPEHPVFTQRGWVQLGQLTNTDSCYTNAEWKLQKKSFSSKVLYIFDTLIVKIHGLKIISEMSLENFYMLLCGKLTIKKKFPGVLLSTIKILIRWIIYLKTYNFLRVRNTPPYTKKKSGKKLKPIHLTAFSVGQVLYQDLQNQPSLDFVLKNAEKKLILAEKRVFNLKVEDQPEYFINGILAHNCDEELPEEMWDEINVRRMATSGYFRMVFTATIGQQIWFDTMECQGTALEKFPSAKKWQVSLYDCRAFEDGSASHIDDDYILRAIAMCKTESEVQKRVMGRFASDSGLKYPTFSQTENVVAPHKIPRSWPIYVGVDIGSGGNQGHPSAIVFCAVSPDYTEAKVFDGWLGEDVQTTDQDVLDKLREMLLDLGLESDRIGGIFYDYHAADFGILAGRQGFSVEKADKSHATGEAVLGVLFKLKFLSIFNKSVLDKLITQLSNLKRATAKKHAIDDFVDALRYALSRVPFDWAKLGVKIRVAQNPVTPVNEDELALKKRRDHYLKEEKEQVIDVSTELEMWQDLHEY